MICEAKSFASTVEIVVLKLWRIESYILSLCDRAHKAMISK